MLDFITFAGLLGTLLFFDNPNLALVFLGFIPLYYLLLEGFTGYTVGKYLVRIQAVREDGRPPGFVKSLIRTLLRIVETNPLFFGAIPAGICALATKKKQRLGDMAANTYVLKVSDLRFMEPSRRTKAVLAGIFTAIICLAVIPNVMAWTITGYPESEPKSTVYQSKDGRFQLTDGAGLGRDSSSMREIGATLVLSDFFKNKSIVVFTYPKEEFGSDLSLEDFYLVMKEERLDKTTTLIQDRMARINGESAYELTYRGMIDKEEYMYIVTFVDTPEHFHEIIAVMGQRYYEEYGPKLRATVATFKETMGEI